jgi:sugar lactone lactonase YvrE
VTPRPILPASLRTELGECPIWSIADAALCFVDITGRAIHRYRPGDGSHARLPVAEDIGCIGLWPGGGFIAGMRTGVFRLDAEGRTVEKLAANPEDHATSRFNDGRTDPRGRFLLGTIDEPKAGGNARLYRYDRRGLTVLVDGLLTSNGLAFSCDGCTLYHADTPRFAVRRYTYDPATGALADPEPFVTLAPTDTDRGRPDGAAVDAEGCYWTALYEGGRIQRYAPDGRLLAEVAVPAHCPTMVAFGGPELRTLYITSARAGRPADEIARLPLSGALFALEVEVSGLPAVPFDPEI